MKALFRYTLRILSTLLLLVVVVLVTVLLQQVDPEQKRPAIETYSFADTLANREYDLDSLRAIIGDNKGLPEGFEIAAAIAYSAYPQLKEVNIDMILTQTGAPMEATVDIWSLFGSGKHRQYLILLNDAQNTFFDPILLRALPFDAQVGILAHELGHVAYYHKLSLFQFGKWGLKYLKSNEFRASHERTTDLMPVYHGLGSQIYQYASFVRNDPTCKSLYEMEKDFIDTYYMTDRELWEVINE
ncbi:hypothetical protein FNH22_08515 [Fulvivirga sp. M361]|uniref:hypothetical protein n=1 Tax=Fulvivirga sp. M361 TaxID=2594266 RepID=UPI00117B02F5|nr:hypothetical protein [Fulvivirga sp. M361]TRX60083.1 hypothetical protein FNH22_08515 [Fulvivirga sp. M361]